MTKEPNFLVIMTDQHCYHQLACHGNSVVKTPNIDKLYKKGSSLNGMYTATPMCMPNRQAFLTMRMNSVNGSHSNGVALDLDSNTFPELLRAAGYKTALIGKSHLQNTTVLPAFQQAEDIPEDKQSPPENLQMAQKSAAKYKTSDYLQEHPSSWQDTSFEAKTPYYGFDDVIFASSHAEVAGFEHKRYLDSIDKRISAQTGRDNSPDASQYNPQTYASGLAPEHYPTQFMADATSNWINEHANNSPTTPFFLWSSFQDPHHPWTPPQKYYDMYDPEDVVLPTSFYESSREQTPLLKAVYNLEKEGKRKPRLPFMAEEAEAKRIVATAYGMISFIDEAVGEILKTLEDNNLIENTVIIFTSDHGDYMGQHGLFLKGPAHYQSLIKVPFIWCDCDSKFNQGVASKNSEVNALASYVDIGRTILDRTNLWPYHGAQGQSLLPVLSGDTQEHRKRVLVETVTFSPQFELPIWAKVRTLVSGHYRISIYSHLDKGELYDLETDPEEMVNLWHSQDHAQLKAELLFQLAQEMTELSDTSRLPLYLA